MLLWEASGQFACGRPCPVEYMRVSAGAKKTGLLVSGHRIRSMFQVAPGLFISILINRSNFCIIERKVGKTCRTPIASPFRNFNPVGSQSQTRDVLLGPFFDLSTNTVGLSRVYLENSLIDVFETKRLPGLQLQTMHPGISFPESLLDNSRPKAAPGTSCDHASLLSGRLRSEAALFTIRPRIVFACCGESPR